MEAKYIIWTSIYLVSSIITYVGLIIRILKNQFSWKTILVDSLAIMVLSSVQLIITSIQLSVILINGIGDDWCFASKVILDTLTKWEIYILFSCLILMTANFHQKLINLINQEYEGQTGTCSRLIQGFGITFVCAIGIFLLAGVGTLEYCHQLRQYKLQNSGLFAFSVGALLILNFLVCYQCFTTDHSMLAFIETSKLIPNLRKSVIGLCCQNISFVILSYPWCVFQNQWTDISIPFWIYCLKSTVLPLVWIVFPELIPNLALGICGKKEDVYVMTIYREYQSRKPRRPMRIWSRKKSHASCLYLHPIGNVYDDNNSLSESENYYQSIGSFLGNDSYENQEPYQQSNSNLANSSSQTNVKLEYEMKEFDNQSKQDVPTVCLSTHSNIVDGYLVSENVYEEF